MPIIGDDKYGDQAVNKYLKKHGIKHLHLSCTELTFEHNKERLTITAPNPKWVNELDRIDKLLTKN